MDTHLDKALLAPLEALEVTIARFDVIVKEDALLREFHLQEIWNAGHYCDNN